ncbi:hypothetical protein [Cellulosimicrobium protaetiae]|uniref:Uncharacterized protein n=1 Tax=Cellulosimicrobium protaetiae TaxID=2587808 RepID=A0A6M5UDE5_9MICO|nr:hypothetical protein [Cellulosimicrobium protaetiae]QJW35225.1 hypothetical protein FIC82_002400 [Cellulosimicrobium protaetiae]
MLTWTAVDDGTWRARNASREYVIRREGSDTWTLDGPGRTWVALPNLEVAQEVAAVADEVHHDDDLLTSYRVVTATGARRGEPFGAGSDDDAMDVLRARRRAGNLPLAPFRLETSDGRTVGSWEKAAEIPARSATSHDGTAGPV